MPITLSADEFAQKYGNAGPQTLSADEFAKRYGDVRGQIEARKANPPAARFGDPNGHDASMFELAAPQLAHPIDAAQGFFSALNPMPAMSDPIGTIKSEESARMAAFDRLKNEGVSNPEFLRDAFEYGVPVMGPMFAQAGRQMNSPNPEEAARGFGSALAITSGPKLLRDAAGIAPRLQSAAETQYGKTFGKNANPAEVQQVTPRLLKEGVTFSSPEDLSNIAEGRATQANAGVDSAIAGMRNGPPTRGVLNGIAQARDQMFNPATDAPIAPDADAVASKLHGYAQRNILGNSTVQPGQLSAQIDPNVALDLKQNFDHKPGARGMYRDAPDAPAADLKAQSIVADSLREQLNKDPNVSAANKEASFWLRTRDMAGEMPANKQIMTPWEMGRAVTGAVMAPFHGATGALIEGSVAAPVLYKLMASPAWRTLSAVTKSRIADMLQSGDYGGASEMAMRSMGAGATTDKDFYLRQKMLANQPGQ